MTVVRKAQWSEPCGERSVSLHELPRDPATLARDQERDDACDVLWRPQSAQGVAFGQRASQVVVHPARVDRTRVEDVGGDAARSAGTGSSRDEGEGHAMTVLAQR